MLFSGTLEDVCGRFSGSFSDSVNASVSRCSVNAVVC
jgi:hypothetical protein